MHVTLRALGGVRMGTLLSVRVGRGAGSPSRAADTQTRTSGPGTPRWASLELRGLGVEAQILRTGLKREDLVPTGIIKLVWKVGVRKGELEVGERR